MPDIKREDAEKKYPWWLFLLWPFGRGVLPGEIKPSTGLPYWMESKP